MEERADGRCRTIEVWIKTVGLHEYGIFRSRTEVENKWVKGWEANN